jgi:Flp pilus assembly protein TadG
MKSISKIWLSARLSVRDLIADKSGIAAIEFAMIVPIMLLMFFGTLEFSSAVAVDRKVTLIARTLSDLTSQATSVADTDLTNFFTASISILTPYSPTPTKATISEIYVDSNKIAKIQWSKAATIASGATQATLATSARSAGDVVTGLVPPALLVKQTSLIFSEVRYLYVPTVGYVTNTGLMAQAGVNLNDVAYSRPRQSACVIYPTPTSGTPTPCPSS